MKDKREYLDDGARNINSDATAIVIQRGNMTFDGAGHSVQGSGGGNGFDLSNTNNVTIRNANINGFQDTVFAFMSSHDTIYGNNMTGNNHHVIELSSSSNNTIAENNLIGNSGHCNCSVRFF